MSDRYEGDSSWCPEHECWFPAGDDCPDCLADNESIPPAECPGICPADFGDPCPDCLRLQEAAEEWGPDDAVGLGPEPPTDGWYLDLVARADFRHDGWRD